MSNVWSPVLQQHRVPTGKGYQKGSGRDTTRFSLLTVFNIVIVLYCYDIMISMIL